MAAAPARASVPRSAGVEPAAGPARAGGWRARWRAFTRYANGVLGADKYERYLAWHRATGQPGEPMDRAAFWRHEYHRQEHNPSTRCC